MCIHVCVVVCLSVPLCLCCLLSVVCCLLSVVRCLLSVVCCLLSVVCACVYSLCGLVHAAASVPGCLPNDGSRAGKLALLKELAEKRDLQSMVTVLQSIGRVQSGFTVACCSVDNVVQLLYALLPIEMQSAKQTVGGACGEVCRCARMTAMRLPWGLNTVTGHDDHLHQRVSRRCASQEVSTNGLDH